MTNGKTKPQKNVIFLRKKRMFGNTKIKTRSKRRNSVILGILQLVLFLFEGFYCDETHLSIHLVNHWTSSTYVVNTGFLIETFFVTLVLVSSHK